MKRLIILCAIIALNAMAAVNAQEITVGPAQTKQQDKQTVKPDGATNQNMDQKTVQPADVKTNPDGSTEKTLQGTKTHDQQVNPAGTVNPKRLGEHGPYLDESNFDAKKAEWMKNYPEEYKKYQQQKDKVNPTK